MYEVTKNVIQSGNYELTDILTKIDTMWLQGSITDSERLSLIEMARGKADPSHSYAPLQAQIDSLAQRVAVLESKYNPADPETPADEYPDYVQPTGAHEAYYNGDKMTYTDGSATSALLRRAWPLCGARMYILHTGRK